jgi:predicted ATP-grasp superfamily ATP-dependent carboligase
MSAVRFKAKPNLEGGTMVAAFHGWNDGGEAATTAATYVRDRWGAQKFAGLDPEDFYDFQVSRPMVRLEEGVTRQIDWPGNDFYHASLPTRQMAVLIGVEPNVRWRTFTTDIVDAARSLGVKKMVTLGAFLADVPHSVPPPVAGSAPTQEMAERLGVVPSRYEGPTGIVGVLQDAAARAGMESVSLWAAVPHYLPAGTNPKAALALVQRLSAYLDMSVETDQLARAAATWETQVATMIEENEELGEYVKRLEEGVRDRGELEMPSGDALAAELERFLREREDPS